MARILSIEDSADIQQMIGMSLRASGYEVHYAFNGQEGYERVLSLGPDLILLDLMIPGINGVELTKRLKGTKETRDIPIIIMTACGDEGRMLESSLKALGAVEYLRKPFSMKELVAVIKRVLAAVVNRPPDGAAPEEVHKGAVRLNVKFRTVWVGDRLVATLPYKIASLCRLLLEAKEGVDRQKLLRQIWSYGTKPNTLEKAVERLRRDLGPEGKRIQTIPKGYEFID